MKSAPLFVAAVLFAVFSVSVYAQVPDALRYAIASPPLGLQSGVRLGAAVAAEGDYIVAGAPYDGTGMEEAGVVKIFDANSGALLYVLPNPGLIVYPSPREHFGAAVAISGTRVLVGAPAKADSSDAGSAYLYDLASATPTVPVLVLSKATTQSTGGFGVTVAISGSRLVVGATEFDNDGAAYVFDLTSPAPATPVFTLKKPPVSPGYYFGSAVALSGDRVVVGAYGEWASGTPALSGRAYVYDLASGSPTVPVATLDNPAPLQQDYFGEAVAISGTQVAIGAPLVDAGAVDAGLVYVYDLASGTPTVPVRTLNNPSPENGDDFGAALAISGTQIVVGAPGDATGASHAGSAYLFDLAGAAPALPVLTWNNPAPAAEDNFGNAMALSGTRVVIGTPLDDAGTVDAGSAYVYDLASALPTTPTVALNASGLSVNDHFGTSVSLSGTLMAVGVPQADAGASHAGLVYIFDLCSAAPALPILTLNNPQPAEDDNFGVSVAISGTQVVVGATGRAYVYDLTRTTPTAPLNTLIHPSLVDDGGFGSAVAISGNWVVVGAPVDSTFDSKAGAAYAYLLNGTAIADPPVVLPNPSHEPTFLPPRFGGAVAISGTRVVVGAPIEAYEQGAAYVYDLGSATPTIPATTLSNPDGPVYMGSRFGASVAIDGTRVVVGAIQVFGFGTSSGAAYVFDLAGATPTAGVATLINPTPAMDDYFGYSVGISGTRIVVGANHDDTGATDAGSAYVYDLASATPTAPVASLHKPVPAAADFLGWSVAIAGATVAVGAPYDSTTASAKGAVYVFAPANPDSNGNGLLDLWEYAHFGTATGHSATDDTDGDGHIELLEEAFNTEPLTPDALFAPAVAKEGGYLTMTIAKRAGVTYQVQSAAIPDPASFSAANTTVLLDDATTLKVRDNFPIGTTPGRFMRVKVTAAP